MTGRTRWARAYDAVLYTLHCVGSYGVLVVMAWMCADVALRILVNRPVPGTFEMVGLSLPVVVFLQLPFILRQRMHLRAPSIDKWLGVRGRDRMERANHVAGAIVFCVAAYALWGPLREAWIGNEYMGEGDIHVPAWPVWAVLFFSCCLMVVEYALQVRLAGRGPARR